MNKRKLRVKTGSILETLGRFQAAWEQAEKGETIGNTPVEIISFENPKLLMKTLTPRRLELLQHLHMLGKTSIRTLAKKLTRDYSNVHEDVKILHQTGLLLKDSLGKYYMPWEKIVTEIPMTIPIPKRKSPVAIRHTAPDAHNAHFPR
jgi:predicted transcriptional regulator